MTWDPETAKSDLSEKYLRGLTEQFPVKVIPPKDDKSDPVYRLPIARLGYYDLFKPGSNKDDPSSTPKYGATLIFPPWEELKPLRKAIQDLAKSVWGEDLPEDLKLPVRRQRDKKDKPGYLPDGFFLNAKANADRKPELLDRKTQEPITDESDLFSGCWVMPAVTLYAFGKTAEERKKTRGARGISIQLRSVIKICEDRVLTGGGGPKAKDVFSDVFDAGPVSSEDDTDYGDLMD